MQSIVGIHEKCRSVLRGMIRASLTATALLVASVLLLAVSCATTGTRARTATADLRGTVRDENGEPVAAALVQVAGADGVVSSSHGSFVAAQVPLGTIPVSVTAERYAPYTGEVSFTERTQVLHVTLRSGDYFLDRAVKAAKDGDLVPASEEIEMAISIQPRDAETRFVAALIAILRGDTASAREHLSEMPDGIDPEPVAHLRELLDSREATAQ